MEHNQLIQLLTDLRNNETDDKYIIALDETLDIVEKYDKIYQIFSEYQWDKLEKNMAFKSIVEVIVSIPKRYWKQK